MLTKREGGSSGQRSTPRSARLGPGACQPRRLAEALEAAFDLGDLAKIEETVAGIDALQPGELTPLLLVGHRARFHARLNTGHGNNENVEQDYQIAEKIFAQHGLAFHHAATQLQRAEWLTSQGRTDEAQPLLDAARETFERLEAKPWLERLDSALAATPAEIPA